VPDSIILVALQSAAFRGVRVQLIIPSRSNHRLALWAGRSFYRELADAGVEIYEYPVGLLHSKVVVVDDAWAMVGSANMDERSFRINFEVTTLLYSRSLTDDLRADFETLRYRADRLNPVASDSWSFGQSLLLGLARLASPLL
jgi:cardiolipin synthase A/B